MELTPCSRTYTRRHLPYLLPCDILGCSFGISLNQFLNLNNLSSPTIAWFSTQTSSQVTIMIVSHPIQTSIVVTSSGSYFMPFVSLSNVVGSSSMATRSTPTLHNLSGSIPSGVSGHVQQSTST